MLAKSLVIAIRLNEHTTLVKSLVMVCSFRVLRKTVNVRMLHGIHPVQQLAYFQRIIRAYDFLRERGDVRQAGGQHALFGA